VLDLLQESQKLAKEIREAIERAPRHRNQATGQVTYGASPTAERLENESGEMLGHEEIFARLRQRTKDK
jgi:threonine aldolase